MITFHRRVIKVNNSKTSVRLSDLEWQALDNLCAQEQISSVKLVNTLANTISNYNNLTAVIRIFITGYYYVADKILYDEQNPKQPNPSRIKDIIMLMR